MLSGSQPITGLWNANQVMVGDRDLTPVAKWFRINDDHSIQSGNGWTQNAAGTWTYDKATRAFVPTDTLGIADEFGAFSVSFRDQTMYWERMEDGMKVVVTLERTTQLPRSTADDVAGLWDLQRAEREGVAMTSAFDPDGRHYLFIRWDRIYVERTPQGERATGYWHIDGHKPEVTFIPHNEGEHNQRWRVSVNYRQLRMVGISETNKDVTRVYERMRAFPE